MVASLDSSATWVCRVISGSRWPSKKAWLWSAACRVLEELKVEGDEQIGVNIVKQAITEPLRMIAENAGGEGAIVLGKVSEAKEPMFGYNAPPAPRRSVTTTETEL